LREKLAKAKAIRPLFDRFDATPRAWCHIVISSQIVDAGVIAAPSPLSVLERNIKPRARKEMEPSAGSASSGWTLVGQS
jgi:hypothetical protein